MRLTCTSAVAKDLRSLSVKSRCEEPAEAGGEAVCARVTGAHAVARTNAARESIRFIVCLLGTASVVRFRVECSRHIEFRAGVCQPAHGGVAEQNPLPQ